MAGIRGQGVVFAGMVLSKAAAVHEKRNGRGLFVSQTQSFAQALEGDIIACDVVISDNSAFYPFVEIPDYLIVMSQPAYDKYIHQVGPGTTIILDEDAVNSRPGQAHWSIPASRKAEEMGLGGSANMITLGALISISGALLEESVLQAIADASPTRKVEINKKAFSEGMNIGRAILESKRAEGSD